MRGHHPGTATVPNLRSVTRSSARCVPCAERRLREPQAARVEEHRGEKRKEGEKLLQRSSYVAKQTSLTRPHPKKYILAYANFPFTSGKTEMNRRGNKKRSVNWKNEVASTITHHWALHCLRRSGGCGCRCCRCRFNACSVGKKAAGEQPGGGEGGGALRRDEQGRDAATPQDRGLPLRHAARGPVLRPVEELDGAPGPPPWRSRSKIVTIECRIDILLALLVTAASYPGRQSWSHLVVILVPQVLLLILGGERTLGHSFRWPEHSFALLCLALLLRVVSGSHFRQKDLPPPWRRHHHHIIISQDSTAQQPLVKPSSSPS